MKNAFLFLCLLFSGLISAANAATHVVTNAQSTATIQSTITSSSVGDTVAFSAGTYALTSPLTLKCGVTYTGPVASPATVILTATGTTSTVGAFTLYSNSNLSNPCTQPTVITYINFKGNATGIYVQTSFTNLTISNNQFTYIVGSTNQTAAMVFQSGTTTSNTASELTNTVISNNQIGDVNSCISPTNVMADVHSPEDYEGACNGMVFFTSINGLTVTYNNFNHVAEGTHINCPNYANQTYPCEPPGGALTQNITVRYNDFNNIHRITWEEQPQQASGIDFEFNSEHDWVSPYFGSYGLSMACCYNGTTPPALNGSNNVIVFNTNPGSNGRYGYGMEAMGHLAIYNNDLVQAVFSSSNAGGMAYGCGPVASMSNNTVQGNFTGNGSLPIENENSSFPCGTSTTPASFTGNVISSTITSFASASPTISPSLGAQTFPLTVTLTDAGFTSGSLPLGNTGIWYTTDGSTPVPGQGTAQRLDSGGTFVLASPATVKAVGMWGSANETASYASGFGFVASPVVSAAYSAGSPTITSGYLSTTPTNGVNTATIGGTIQFAPIANYSNGANNVPIAASACSWTTSDPTVIIVGASTGLVTASGAGKANVIATCSGVQFSYWTVTVATPAVTLTGITVVPYVAYVTAPLTPNVVGTYSDDSVGAPSGVTWTSSNTAVATVNAATGLVTPVGVGSTIITASVGNFTAVATIIVPYSLQYNGPNALGFLFQSLTQGTYTLVVNADGTITLTH